MNTHWARSIIKWGVFLTLAISADSAFAADDGGYPALLARSYDVKFQFTQLELAGVETDRLRDRLETIRVRGWHVSKNSWFGQTLVGRHRGVGLVVQKGNTVYQFNNRGFQVTRFF